jgi:hypothetical protein
LSTYSVETPRRVFSELLKRALGSKWKMSQGMKGNDYDPSMGVTWGERHQVLLEKIWSKVPSSFARYLASLIVFILGCTISGHYRIILYQFI